MRLVAEVGIQGAHAAVLSEMLLELAELAYEKVQNVHDEFDTNTDEVNPVLPYSTFSQLNANTSDGCLFGDVDGLELTVRAVGEQGLNLGKEMSDLVVRGGRAVVEIRRHPPAAWDLLSKHKVHGPVWSQTCLAGGSKTV